MGTREKWRQYGHRLASTVSMASVGLEFGVSVGGGGLLGLYLDERFATAPWCTVAGVSLGLAVGTRCLWHHWQRLREEQDEPE
jgi:F0F1-type ATP synthase assembly protein I